MKIQKLNSDLMAKKRIVTKCNTVCNGFCCTKINNFGVVRGSKTILKDVNIHIHCGELTAIIGPNGAGKSTLLKAILGEISHSGALEFLDEKDRHTGKPVIGYVPQKLDFDNTSPVSVYDLFAAAHSDIPVWSFVTKKMQKKAIESLTKVNAAQLLNKKIGMLSGGELQRVLLALALDPIPDLLLLDEPVSGIDQSGLKMFYETVSTLRNEYDLSIILVSHDLDLVAKFADRVVFLDNNTVECIGTPREVFHNPCVIDKFGLGWLGEIVSCDEAGEKQ